MGAAPQVDATEPAVNTVSGLPCNVAAMLTAKCATCHGEPLSGGAPNRILTREDLMAPSGKATVAEASLLRMQNAKNPMPPGGADAADTKLLADWIAAGSPADTCATSPGTTPVTGTSSVCTSKVMWTRGDSRSAGMHPGVACIDCHDRKGAPSYSAAGTVYPTAHEPDDCNGQGGATIEITDASGTVYRTTANAAGNFYLSDIRNPIKMPYTVKVTSGTKTSVMKTPATSGDCNTCHTESGASKAPGRIYLP
jgi:cytochrome c553